MPRPNVSRALPTPPVVSIWSRLSIGSALTRGGAAPASGASPWSDAANTLMAFPFTLEVPTPNITKGWWTNGASVGNNSEIVLLDDAFKVLATTGSVAGSGASVPQAAAWTGGTIALPAGRYYCGMAHNATTTGQVFRISITTVGTALFMAAGCWKAAVTLGSITVGSTITPADLTNVAFPLFGIITRTVFDV